MSERLKQFKEKGYAILPGLLNPEELSRLKRAMEEDVTLRENEYGRSDGRGMRTRLTLWNSLPSNVAGSIVRAEKTLDIVEELLEGDVYHYHSKLVMKEPHTGGAFLWHQDYGYWYNFKCLRPTMGTLWIAVDRADRTNGCLQILEGSHKLGRLDTIAKGDQIVTDPERLNLIKEKLPLRYVELNPGDAIFFHSNLLHTSDQNRSGNRRWSYLVAYNRSDNQPYGEHPHAEYQPLERLPNSSIMTSPLTMSGDNLKFWKGSGSGTLNTDLRQPVEL